MAGLAHLCREPGGATAMICTGMYAVETVTQQIGAALPATLSVVGVTEPAQPVDEITLMTTYEVDLNRIVEWTMQMLIESVPAQRPQQVIVPGVLVYRGSTPAPHMQQAAPAVPTEAVI